MGEDAVYGMAIGIGTQFVAADIKTLKEQAKQWFSHQLAQEDWRYEPEIEQAELRLNKFKIQPSYQTDKGVFPVPETTTISVVSVYGVNADYGYAKCYLPTLGKSFHYYNKKQLKTLIEHFARESLEGTSPAHIHAYHMPHQPWLESVRVRADVKDDNERFSFDPALWESVSRFAESLPVKRSIRRAYSVFPESAWERTEFVNGIANRLAEEDGHLMLVGEPGCGKSVAWMEAIQKAFRQTGNGRSADAPTFWRTQAQRMIANANYLGEWQEQVETFIDDLESLNGVLWFTDLIELLRIGGDGGDDSVAAFMLPALIQKRIRLIAEMNPKELAAARQIFPAFMAQFQILPVTPLGEDSVKRIGRRLAEYARENLHVSIDTAALNLSRRLLTRFAKYEHMPGKWIRFANECMRYAEKNTLSCIDADTVVAVFNQRSGLPEIMLRDDMRLMKSDLTETFCARVLHQEQAVEAMCNAVLVFKTGMNDPHKPIATLLFSGPTGVGKTAAAHALSDYFFSSGQRQHPLFRLDMSEFQHPSQIHRLIGQGNRPGKLVQHVRDRPFSVLLFDEIEKAHPAIFDILLGVFDEGMLVDRYGRVTDFCNTIIIMTSNLGAQQSAPIGFAQSAGDDRFAVEQFFRPEFINRIDQIVGFNSLDQQAIAAIALKELAQLHQREGLRKRQIQLDFSAALIAFIREQGFHPLYGARPLQRAIEQHVIGTLAQWLLKNRYARDCTIHVDYDGSAITLSI